MKPRKPISFILFCISTGVLLFVIVTGLLLSRSHPPGIVSGLLILLTLLALLLIPANLILGIVYRTDIPEKKRFNRIALWGTITVLVLIVGFFAIYYHINPPRGFAAPG